jgi:SAM-dependent methyltransferase
MLEMQALRCRACGYRLSDSKTIPGVDRLHGSRGAFLVAICRACGSGVTLPVETSARLASFYPAGYGPYEDGGSGIVGLISSAIRWYQSRRLLARLPLSAIGELRAGRLVDVGCGRGDLAAALVKRGWDAVGVEPSASACAAARSRGIDARQGTLADVPLEPESYDVAILHHSLEHTPDPSGDLRKLSTALRPGGLVLITVPNFESWQRLRFADAWYHLDLPRHRTHFTAAGLRAALAEGGLAVESMTTSTSTVGLPATLQYAAVKRCLFPDGLGLRVASSLCVLTLPFTRLLDALRGGGDQLHAVAAVRLPRDVDHPHDDARR